jgi:hypothetical protein
MIPVKYNIRNMRVRWMTTMMTVVATALVVWASVLTFGLTEGLEHALKISGDPLDIVVMRKGSDADSWLERSPTCPVYPRTKKENRSVRWSSSRFLPNLGGTTVAQQI